MSVTHDVPPTRDGSRQLSVRELATIRAALRLWIGNTLDPDILEESHAEAGGAPLLSDDEIEQFLVELANAGDVVITPLVAPTDLDQRRI